MNTRIYSLAGNLQIRINVGPEPIKMDQSLDPLFTCEEARDNNNPVITTGSGPITIGTV